MSPKTVLVTGGAGFVGSHTCVEILNAGYHIVVVDSLINSSEEALNRVKKLTGKDLIFYKFDMMDLEGLKSVFQKHKIDSVIHFAGRKAVGESVQIPLLYYSVNINIAINLLQAMEAAGVKDLVFSSSCTVYGEPDKIPISEKDPVKFPCSCPYGTTKLICEQIFKDFHKVHSDWNLLMLRYFNPIGAHPSGEIGEDPLGIPNNLVPYVTQVAIGKRSHVNVFGNDYSTPDGTGVRDYIHVVDLAKGHMAALRKLEENPGYDVVNLGTGKGASVLEVIQGISNACGKEVPYQFTGRREGDLAAIWADPAKATTFLNWSAQLDLSTMCQDAWNFQKKNPNGYQ